MTTSSASEREEAVRPQIEFSAVDLSPEKDLQHRLEVLALATDGEERCPMEGRPFHACRHSVECVSVRRLEDSSAALDVTNFFSHPAHPWVCYWKLIELGALLDSFELEMD